MVWATEERDWSEKAGGTGDLGLSCAGGRRDCRGGAWTILETGEGARSEVILDWLGADGGVLDLARSSNEGELLPLTRS